jgi:uridine phosphorylase
MTDHQPGTESKHRTVGADGRVWPFGESIDPLNAPMLDRYRYIDNIPMRGFTINGRPALTQIDPEAIGDFVVLVVRDPLCDYASDPAEQFAEHLDDVVLAGKSGMFTTFSGTYKGATVSVISGGSGSPEAELALVDLLEYTDAHTYMRVGGSGGMHPSVSPGDLVIASGVVRDEGMTASYVSPSYPAASAPELVMALTEAAIESGHTFHVGTIRSADSDYVQGGRPSVAGYFQPWHLDIAESWIRAGVLNGDRESAAVVTLARLFGKRGGAICSVADNLSTGAEFTSGAGHLNAMEVALEGIAKLNQMDYERDAAGYPMWVPSLRNR